MRVRRQTDGQAGERTVTWATGLWNKLAIRLSVCPPARLLRAIAGMPDHAAYVEHLRRCHPERPVPTEGEFYDEFVRARYGDGPTRCC